jgi:hypothetical protein
MNAPSRDGTLLSTGTNLPVPYLLRLSPLSHEKWNKILGKPNQEYIKFGECLLLFSPKSFVFPSHIKKPKD